LDSKHVGTDKIQSLKERMVFESVITMSICVGAQLVQNTCVEFIALMS